MKALKMLNIFTEQLEALNLKEGYGVDLGNDRFLTGYLDGADKIYGFAKEDGEFVVIGSESSSYPIGELTKGDLRFIIETFIDGFDEYEIVKIKYI